MGLPGVAGHIWILGGHWRCYGQIFWVSGKRGKSWSRLGGSIDTEQFRFLCLERNQSDDDSVGDIPITDHC